MTECATTKPYLPPGTGPICEVKALWHVRRSPHFETLRLAGSDRGRKTDDVERTLCLDVAGRERLMAK
jgi:hypothetical protein